MPVSRSRCSSAGLKKIAAPLAGLQSAWMPIVEQLEERRFFAVDTVQTLPFVLSFNTDHGDLLDKDGQGTGFTRVQANNAGNQYQASLIDLDVAAGVLKLTTSGSSTTGSNTDGQNSLINALETQFNATTSGFKISARLLGPLSYISQPAQQAGIFFGPDQDNYVKLSAIAQNGNTYIQFMDEQKSGS
ncbi:MAG: large repetitive protein, partial [Phycisphaerales bacterium]|nr:large repetitive protein [Phycisphaerales bacterium]